MGFCILGGKENYLRKMLSDKLTSLGQVIGIGATATAFTDAIQTIYNTRYTDGQDSLKTARKLTLTSSQTGSNVDIADNWYTTCDASAVYTAGQNSLKVARKLTLTASQTGNNVNITDNWYTTCDASAVYAKGKTDATISNVDAQKISVYMKIHDETHIYGGENVSVNATITITLPNGVSGTKSVSNSAYTSGDVTATASNVTLATGIVLNSMTATGRDRNYGTLDATFTVTYNGSSSKVRCKLNSDNNQDGSGSTSSWHGDGESTRYIVVNGTMGYQKLSVSSSTIQMI